MTQKPKQQNLIEGFPVEEQKKISQVLGYLLKRATTDIFDFCFTIVKPDKMGKRKHIVVLESKLGLAKEIEDSQDDPLYIRGKHALLKSNYGKDVKRPHNIFKRMGKDGTLIMNDDQAVQPQRTAPTPQNSIGESVSEPESDSSDD